MKYYYDNVEYEDWWSLIEKCYYHGTSLIAHNENDILSVYNRGRFKLVPSKLTYEEEIVEKVKNLLLGNQTLYSLRKRDVFKRYKQVFDENGQVVNLAEIYQAIADFNPDIKRCKKTVHFYGNEYRREPCPWRGKRHHCSIRGKLNLNYYLDATSHYSDFRIKKQLSARMDPKWKYDYSDNHDFSWKRQTKKRKQWLKQ